MLGPHIPPPYVPANWCALGPDHLNSLAIAKRIEAGNTKMQAAELKYPVRGDTISPTHLPDTEHVEILIVLRVGDALLTPCSHVLT